MWPATVVCGVGAVTPDLSSDVPSGIVTFSTEGFQYCGRSVRKSLARRTAPSMLSWPAPCSKALKPASGCAVYIRMALTMFGVRRGLWRSSSEAAPATSGAAIEVPFIVIMFRVLSALTYALSCGLLSRMLLSAAAAQMTLLPGATRSGLIRLSWCTWPAASVQEARVGPREL